MNNAGPIRGRLNDTKNMLHLALIEALHPVAFMDFKLFDFLKAEKNIGARESRQQFQSKEETTEKWVEEESTKLSLLEAQAEDFHRTIEQLQKEIADIQASLAQKKQELQIAEAKFT